MKKLGIIMLCVVGSMTLTYAQEEIEKDFKSKTPEEFAQQRSKKLGEQLTLTEDQKQQVYDASKEHFAATKSKREEIHKLKKELHEERKAYDAQVESFLTEDQKVAYAKLKEERKEKHMERRKGESKPPCKKD